MNELGREVTRDAVDSLAACNRLLPREDDFKGKPGYIPADDKNPWRYRYKLNDGHGKMTREAQEVGELLRPSSEAHTARHLSRGPGPQAMLRDKDGGVRYVDPALASDTARERGWSHAWRAGGCRVERGIDGELWRELPDGTREPTGRWCLTAPQPWATVPEGGNADGSMKL